MGRPTIRTKSPLPESLKEKGGVDEGRDTEGEHVGRKNLPLLPLLWDDFGEKSINSCIGTRNNITSIPLGKSQ
jgi:hypothetical protein